MNYRNIQLPSSRILEWGKQGENKATRLSVDVSEFIKLSEGTIAVSCCRPDGKKYPHDCTINDTTVEIELNSYDTQVCGILTIVVSWMCGERIVKSEIYCGEISRSISTSGEKPTPPFDGLIEQVSNAAIKAKESADIAEAAAERAENAGGITEETDPTVPAWAKQPTKPSYTADEVNARPADWKPTPQEIGAASAGDVVKISGEITQLKDDLYIQAEKTLSTNDDFDWQSGWFENDGTVHEHPYFKHSKVFKTVQGSIITFTDLRAPANYVACIACFSGTKYVHDVSLKGEAYTAFSSGTFTVPENIDGVSFVSYVDAASSKRIAVVLTLIETKCDENESNIKSLISENQEIKKQIKNVTEDVADVYKLTNYIPTDGLAVVGKYYDINGRLQLASNMSTTGIIEVPAGIKNIYYNAYRNIVIPTMLFFDADMQIVGTVIAATAPVYGDATYSGYAEIPSTAKYMEASMNNTITDQIVTVRYSKVNNNLERIEKLEKDPLTGLKITCTGNSITAATHSIPGHGYVEQIADAHGMTVDNHAIWGAIIPQGHPRASGDITDIGCIHDTLDSMEADADIVIMSGSINDCEYYSDASFLGEITGDFSSGLNLTTFYGALENMCKKALQKWAGKPIIYVIEHRMTLDNTTYGQYYLKLHEAIVKVMNKWGISIVDLFNDCPSLNYNDGYRAQYTTGDGTHPNYDGYAKFYVPRVYAEIKRLMGI